MNESFKNIVGIYDALGDAIEEIHTLRAKVKHLKEVNEILRETINVYKPVS